MKPSVSVILPARDEAHTIRRALRSLQALEYPGLEVLVVDDCSSDATYALAEEWVTRYRGDKRFALLRSPGEPPPGWSGKTYAADYAITQSSGELIVVCDADVTHETGSLAIAAARMSAARLDLLSRVPRFTIRSPSEYPLLWHTALMELASRLCAVLGSRQSFAMGTYLMFTREFYERSGGWAAHRAYPEPLPLLNYCIKSGGRFELLSDGCITARMYEGALGTFCGLVRNTNFSLLQPLPLLLYAASIGALATALHYALGGRVLAAAALGVCMTLLAARLLRLGYGSAAALGAGLTFPLAPLYMLGVALVALTRRLFNLPLSWHGRRMYPQ